MEVLLVFREILRGYGFEGVGDDEAVFFLWLGCVLWVDGGLVPEGGGVCEVIYDEALHELSLGEVPIEDIHFGLVDTSQALEFSLSVGSVGNGPFVFEDEAEA